MPKLPFNRQKFIGDRVALPVSFSLVIIIAVSILLSMILTGRMASEEAELTKIETKPK